jgi:4-methylaminobutanoate oxidase (formaldehyde-forming)
LQNVCAGQIDVDVGRIVYTQMLNSKGGIESDLTVTRLSESSFLLVVPCATVQRDLAWLNKHNSGLSVVILDFSAGEAVLCLMGPNSRKVLSGCSPNNFSNEAHPFGVWRNIEIGMGLARAHRVTYVGELGWEIYVSSDQAQHVFEEIQVAGVEHNLKLCGMHTLDSCRIEKAYRHFGHDITDEDHVLEAGLGFAVKVEKGNFIGRDAVLKKRDEGMNKVLLQFALKDPSPMMFHNEPIVRDDVIVGYISSANYGHYIGSAIGLGYVPCKGEDLQTVLKSQYEIEIAGKRFESRVSAKPMYDPKSLRTKM